jgi:hypothetical protein
MANEENLKPFKKGHDPRRAKGRPLGSFSLTTAVKNYLMEAAKDGETYGDKLKKAAVLRAISKSDVLMKEIWDRTDGKVLQPTDLTSLGEKIMILPAELINKNDTSPDPKDSSGGQAPVQSTV